MAWPPLLWGTHVVTLCLVSLSSEHPSTPSPHQGCYQASLGVCTHVMNADDAWRFLPSLIIHESDFWLIFVFSKEHLKGFLEPHGAQQWGRFLTTLQTRASRSCSRDGAALSSAQPPRLAGFHLFTLLIQVSDLPHGHLSFSIQLDSTGPTCPDLVSNASLCLVGFISVALKDATKPKWLETIKRNASCCLPHWLKTSSRHHENGLDLSLKTLCWGDHLSLTHLWAWH